MVLDKAAASTRISQRRLLSGRSCGLDNVHVSSVFTSDCGVVLFLSCYIMIREWPCRML